MIGALPVSDRTRSILRGSLAVLAVAACYEATARSGWFAPAARSQSWLTERTPDQALSIIGNSAA